MPKALHPIHLGLEHQHLTAVDHQPHQQDAQNQAIKNGVGQKGFAERLQQHAGNGRDNGQKDKNPDKDAVGITHNDPLW